MRGIKYSPDITSRDYVYLQCVIVSNKVGSKVAGNINTKKPYGCFYITYSFNTETFYYSTH